MKEERIYTSFFNNPKISKLNIQKNTFCKSFCVQVHFLSLVKRMKYLRNINFNNHAIHFLHSCGI